MVITLIDNQAKLTQNIWIRGRSGAAAAADTLTGINKQIFIRPGLGCDKLWPGARWQQQLRPTLILCINQYLGRAATRAGREQCAMKLNC